MKLHHFVTAEPTQEAKHVKQLGKLLVSPAPEPTSSDPVVEAKKADTKKHKDPKQEMRDYAVDQLAAGSSVEHVSAHHKIKHYD